MYLDAFQNFPDANGKINHWFGYYNHERPHSSLGDQTPDEVYRGIGSLSLAA
ncbi:MAG: integrase core domain-containing protein [Woeseiaceae bacterium]